MTIFWWFRGLETGRDRYHVYGWIAAGGGFLAKGLVAPAVALLVDRAVLLLEPPVRTDAGAVAARLDRRAARLRPDRRAVADRAGRALPLVAAREADRRIHHRALHRRRRKPVRARSGTTCRSSSSASSRGSRSCRWPSSTRCAVARRHRAETDRSRGSCASRLRVDRRAARCSSASRERSFRTTSRSSFRRWL